MIAVVFLVVAAALAAAEQPIPYSHKLHVGLGLKCNNCHKNPDPGEAMGLPGEALCLSCHRTIKADSPHIQKLAEAAATRKAMDWVRVYSLPKFVYFSHRVHTKANVSCETCHGPVAEREVITKEVVHNMKACMACHAAKQAPNNCDTCHEEH